MILNFEKYHNFKLIDLVYIKAESILIGFNNEEGISLWNFDQGVLNEAIKIPEIF